MWHSLGNFSAWVTMVIYIAAVLLTVGFWIWMTCRQTKKRQKKPISGTESFTMPPQNQRPAARP